jgi:hypothetical protein
MTTSFNHPSSEKLLGLVSQIFKTKKIYQRRNHHVIFLCGGPIQVRSRSMRKRFFKYSEAESTQFRIFPAEVATKDLVEHNDKPEFINIAEFETLIADISDCIIIFPESAGSIAEIGYFANSEISINKLLVVNDINKHAAPSFINLGIIDKINSQSEFRPIIFMDFKKPKDKQFKLILDRLNERLPTSYRKKFEFNKFTKFESSKQALFLLFEIIYIFRAVTLEDIIYCLENIFGNVPSRTIKLLLSILIAIKYVNRDGEENNYFLPSPDVEPFFEFVNYDIQELQAKVIYFYKKNNSDAYNIISEVLS